jgi:hypothetical protein
MFIQLTTPRIVLDHTRYPEHIYFHTLSKPNVSEGTVLFTGTVDPEHGERCTKTLEPHTRIPLDEDMEVKIFVLPFWELFKGGPKTAMHDGAIVRAADLSIVRYCTAGFQVTAKSAFRAGPRTYEEHTLSFHMSFPATGGGILRIADSFLDLSNPSFDPWAPNPKAASEAAKSELRQMYGRTHAAPNGRNDIEARRRGRIAAAEASMEKTRETTPTLPEGRRSS